MWNFNETWHQYSSSDYIGFDEILGQKSKVKVMTVANVDCVASRLACFIMCFFSHFAAWSDICLA